MSKPLAAARLADGVRDIDALDSGAGVDDPAFAPDVAQRLSAASTVKRDEAGRLRPVKPRMTGSHRKRIDEPTYQMIVLGGVRR